MFGIEMECLAKILLQYVIILHFFMRIIQNQTSMLEAHQINVIFECTIIRNAVYEYQTWKSKPQLIGEDLTISKYRSHFQHIEQLAIKYSECSLFCEHIMYRQARIDEYS